MIRVCRDCNKEFNTENPHNNQGFINQCGDCADDVTRYVGRNDAANKAGSGMHVFRTPTSIAIASSVCQAECRAGFNANLQISSPVTQSAKEDAKVK